jgi:phosphoribosylamine-glycine ligase
MRILVLAPARASTPSLEALHKNHAVTHVDLRARQRRHRANVPTAPVDVLDTDAVIRLVDEQRIDLTVVGPEAPLGNGLADRFEAEGRRVFGPTRGAAQLETSKAFAKDFMHRHRVPTARYLVCTSAQQAVDAIRSGEFGDALVVKADGLAAGKGVVVAPDRSTAEAAVNAAMVDRSFGDAGSRVVLEELLTGPRSRSSSLPMAINTCRCRLPRTTNAFSMMTRDQTRAAWVRFRQVR